MLWNMNLFSLLFISFRFFLFVSFLWKKHLSPCKVTLLISLCASSHCCLLMYPKDSQSTRDCDVSGMSLSVLLPPPLPACNLIYSCDAFFAVWHACSVLICDIIWGSIRVRKKGRRLVTVTICIELSAMLQARGNATFKLHPVVLQIHFEFGSAIAKVAKTLFN